MERRIQWQTGCYDEIDLVYEKAERNPGIAALLSELETMALNDTEESCGLLVLDNQPLTRESVRTLSQDDLETLMVILGQMGLESFVPSMKDGSITVTLSPRIQQVLGCTLFSILNRLEKLDGAFNVRFPNAKLELRVPLGGKKGLMKCEMLIMQLYPWLSITETSSGAVASTL